MHGLRGHPQHTWEDSRGTGSVDRDSVNKGDKDVGTAVLRKRDKFTALFKSKPLASEESPNKLFWPNEYLTEDIPEARVWTYGYNADTIGGLFEANNKNSISQHGRDFAVRIEREIRNEVGALQDNLGGRLVLKRTGPDLLRSPQPRRHYRQRCTSRLLNIAADAYIG